ncbi:MAG: STAS domain-containing protein [Candidatus Acidiferrales bacterium]
MFHLEEKHVGPITILALEGSLTSGGGSGELVRKLTDLTSHRHCALLLECSHLGEIDSEGVGALIKGLTAAQKRGGALKLLNLPPHVQRVLSVLGMLQVFEFFANEERAVASFH